MAQDTNIEWTDKSWNFLRGCSRVSEGCRNCYAERTAIRFAKPGEAYHGLVQSTPGGPKWTGKVEFFEHILLEPLKWRKPCRVFVNSMSDLFHEKVTDEMLDKAFAVMALTPQHTYQILTKRPERMREYFSSGVGRWQKVLSHAVSTNKLSGRVAARFALGGANSLENVHLGVSIEDQKTADERIPLLLQTPAAVRWVSYEPALGPVELYEGWRYGGCSGCCWTGCVSAPVPGGFVECACVLKHLRDETFAKLDWIVVGGESGPGARPFDIQWARNIIAQCKAADVPVFVKQLGAVPMVVEREWRHGNGNNGVTGHLLSYNNRNKVPEDFVSLKFENKKGGDMSEWPEDLRVRQMPEVVR